jgi:sulfonate transport system substrate-binding protein
MKPTTFVRSAALAGLLGIALTAPVAAQKEPIPFKIGANYSSDHAPAFVGVEKGIFAKHGLDAKLVMYPTGVESINGLMAGSQDVNVMGTPPFLVSVSKGMPLVLIALSHGDALTSSYSPFSIVSGASAAIKQGDAKSLAGKRIGVARGTVAEAYLTGILSQGGLKIGDVTLVNVAQASLVTALRQGNVDAVSSWEPWATMSAARVPGASRVFSGGCGTCFDPGTTLTTRANANSKGEAIKRFTLAYAEAMQWVRQNPDGAAEISTRWIPGVDAEILKDAIRRSTFDPRLSKLTVEGFNTRSIPVLIGQKSLSKEFDVREHIDPQFIRHAEAAGAQFFSDLKPIPAATKY